MPTRLCAVLATQGRFEESIAESQRAQELDPVSPRVIGILGYYYHAAGRYDDSVAQFKKALELDPTAPWLHCMLGWTYARQGAYEKAINEHEKMGAEVLPVTTENQFFAAGLGWIYALAGRQSDALKVIAQLKELEKDSLCRPVQPCDRLCRPGRQGPGFRRSRSGVTRTRNPPVQPS